MRDYKFRGKRIDKDEWVYGYLLGTDEEKWIAEGYYKTHFKVIPETVGLCTNHSIKGIFLFEDDIVRLEENEEGTDPEDKITFYIVTWIKEWCMFSLLRVEDEYFEYKNGNIDNLDTTMFWTFPLDVEDIGPSQYYLCGNIHSNSELLQPKTNIK